MTPTELRRKLRAGERLFGTLIVSPSPRWPDAVRDCGLDFVFLDTEHVALDRSQVLPRSPSHSRQPPRQIHTPARPSTRPQPAPQCCLEIRVDRS